MAPSLTPFLLGLAILGCVWYVLKLSQRERGLPPGPPTIAILGNLHLFPKSGGLHLKFTEWSKEYGDIVSLKMGTGIVVVLSSPTAIKEVVDKRGWVASSRPENHLAGLAVGGYHLLFAPDTPRLRNLRKSIARFFSPQNSLNRMPILSAECSQLLHELMVHPETFSDSIRRYTHSLAMISVYGQRVASIPSPQMQRFYKMLHEFLHILVPGVYPPIDAFPALKHLPERWAPWLAACRRSKSAMAGFHAEVSAAAEAHLEKQPSEVPDECFMSCILRMNLPAEELQVLSYTGVPLVEAGSDTSAAFLLSLVLILALYPEYQERASKEIESVVGTTRLPELTDFKNTPFIGALIKEVIRIRPTFPLGIPHSTTSEIRYKDYIVPKNTTVFMNTYAIFHNPDIFDDPDAFNPERFLQSEYGTRPGMDTDFRDNFSFGGGRRICPGQYIANATMQLTTMRLIWAFRFGSARDAKTGLPLTRDLDFYASEFLVMPHPFQCTIEPRNGERREIVIQAFQDVKVVLGRYEH
ncbi:cytochrome P450 [Mycena crocata]|nr:cytochrome P450 [Mycena crocata]